MIRLVNVNKYFNKRKSNQIHAINNTSIELGGKGLVAFLGNSGCGKTTLLNAIGGLDKVDKGEIYIDGKKFTNISENKKDEIRNEYIGYIFQNYNLIEDQTVFFNVAIVLRMMGIRDDEEIEKRVSFILKKVGIERYKKRPVKALSGGERQRVGIARALVKSPKIIIADEPTGNLDSKNTIEIMNIIKAIAKEKLVILVTHERDIAEFYADRIVEIVDGKIVSDKENDNAKELDYHLENKIYLKDLPVADELSKELVDIKYFSDNPDKPLNLTIVVKNNNIYIKMPPEYRVGSDATELVDGHYEKIGKDIYEDYSFDYQDIQGKKGKIKYTSVFSWFEILINGYKKVFGYSIIKKVLLLGFVFASLLTMYSISTISASQDIKDENFMRNHKEYIYVETGKLTPKVFEKFANMDNVEYALPGEGLMPVVMPLDDFYQSSGAFTENVIAAIADINKISKGDLVAGKLPKGKKQVILDEMVANKIIQEGSIKNIGVDDASDFVGRKINGGSAGELFISGVSNSGSPAIYMDKSNFYKVMVGNGMFENDQGSNLSLDTSVRDYENELEEGNISLKAGSLPKKGQVMVSYDYYGQYYVGSTSSIVVNGEKLKISGFYEDRIAGRDLSFVNSETFNEAVITSCHNLVISPKDKYEMMANLEGKGKIHDIYEEERTEYVKGLESQMFSTLLVSIIILIISIVEIYLILRASFLSRVKEVGVLRSIGLKKKDVYKMFFGEIFAMTTITSIPSFILMGYYLYKIDGMPYIGEFVKMDMGVAIISVAIVVVSNLVFGLLPVFTTMRKTPAAILARNDIN